MSDPCSARGLVIARLPFGNTSLIVRCLTEQAGRLTFMAKGASRPRSPFAGMLDLFYLGDFLYQPSRSGEMHTLREARVIEPNLGLRRSYANLMAAQYFAALIEAVTEAGTPLPGEYALFAKAISYLAEADASLAGGGALRAAHRRAWPGLANGTCRRRSTHCTGPIPVLRADLQKLLAAKIS